MSNKKNVLTIAVAIAALLLTLVVVLVATGVINIGPDKTEPETIVETDVVVVSKTNEQGEVEYMTMVTKYYKPNVTVFHKYPTKPTTTGVSTTAVNYIEQTSYVYATNPDGSVIMDDNGVIATEVVSYTVREDSITSAPPKTSAVAVTGEGGVQQTDASGNPVTEVVTYYETTEPDIWATESTGTTKQQIIVPIIERDDALADNIIAEINKMRVNNGLEPLDTSSLKSAARTNSQNVAYPEYYANKLIAPNSYMVETSFGGKSLFVKVSSENEAKILSPDTTKIGVGITIRDGIYYTTVIFG